MRIRTIVEKVIRAKVTFGRGMSWLGEFKNILLFAMAVKIFGFSNEVTFLVSIIFIFLIYLIGFADIRKIKSMQYEQRYITELNPILKKVNRIKVG